MMRAFTYRGFEVKTLLLIVMGILNQRSVVLKHQKIKGQLDKLKQFGCEQIFLLELFVLERGYSSRNNFPSDEINKEILEKAKYLQKLGYGYVVMAEEPSPTHDDESGGMVHMPINVLRTTSNSIGSHFQNLVDSIDKFLADSTTQDMLANLSQHDQFGTKVGYCVSCKKLTMFIPIKFTSPHLSFLQEVSFIEYYHNKIPSENPAQNSPKEISGANGKFLPKPLLFHLRHPNSKRLAECFAKSFPQKNSFGKTESALFRHLPEYLEAEPLKEKHPFLFQKKFHPRQIRNARSVFLSGLLRLCEVRSEYLSFARTERYASRSRGIF